jgi:peptide chain release factor 1
MSKLLKKLKIFEDEYRKLMSKLSEPEIASNPEKIREYGKKISEVEEAVRLAGQYREILSAAEEAAEMLDLEQDEEMKEFLNEEVKENNKKKASLEKKIKLQL